MDLGVEQEKSALNKKVYLVLQTEMSEMYSPMQIRYKRYIISIPIITHLLS